LGTVDWSGVVAEFDLVGAAFAAVVCAFVGTAIFAFLVR
jgi:hypothetical protein